VRIGPESYHWHDIRSAGVPRGGRFGRPRAIAKKLKRFGIFVAWSDIGRCFDIYTKSPGGRLVSQWRCLRGVDPLPLTDGFAELMIFLKHEQGKAKSVASMMAFYKQQQAKRAYEAESQKRKIRDELKREAIRAAQIRMRERTPMESIIVPAMYKRN